MTVTVFRLVAAVIMLMLSSASVQSANAASWSLNQYCQLYGPVRVDIGQSGAKLATNRLTILISSAGSATIYNNVSKSYCPVSSSASPSKFSFMSTPGQAVKGGTKSILNLRASQYWCGGFDRKGRMIYTTEFWTSNDLNLPPTYTDKYLKMCGLPPGLGMPLQVVRHYGDVKNPAHRKSIFLDTAKVTPANLAPANFTAPTGYKLVADEMEVLVGDQLE